MLSSINNSAPRVAFKANAMDKVSSELLNSPGLYSVNTPTAGVGNQPTEKKGGFWRGLAKLTAGVVITAGTIVATKKMFIGEYKVLESTEGLSFGKKFQNSFAKLSDGIWNNTLGRFFGKAEKEAAATGTGPYPMVLHSNPEKTPINPRTSSFKAVYRQDGSRKAVFNKNVETGNIANKIDLDKDGVTKLSLTIYDPCTQGKVLSTTYYKKDGSIDKVVERFPSVNIIKTPEAKPPVKAEVKPEVKPPTTAEVKPPVTDEVKVEDVAKKIIDAVGGKATE